jgi:hypothetical protein
MPYNSPMKFGFLIPCLLAASLLHGADSDVWKKYNNLIDDPDLYVGEGVAETTEFHGDANKISQAAHERARAALASSIRVHVSGQTTESVQSGPHGLTESVESGSKSQVDADLEGLRYRDFSDFPGPGKTTTLAYLSREDYRRQLAGRKAPVYASEFGIRFGLSPYLWPSSMQPILEHSWQWGQGAGQNSTDHVGYSLDFLWRGWVLGGDIEKGAPGGFQIFSLGYEWAPWNTRLQPWFPLRAEVAGVQYNNNPAVATGASLGAGLRFWFTEGLAFEGLCVWHQGITSGTLAYGDGSGEQAQFSLNGLEVKASIQWSGF